MHSTITDTNTCLDHPDSNMVPIPNEPQWRRCDADGCMFTRRR